MSNKEKNFVSGIVYVHNCESRIEEFLNCIIDVFQENFENSEIICVNDYSSDDSVKKIKKISKKASSTSISVVNMSEFHGLEMSMNAGMDLSIGDFVFEFDKTVLDFNPKEIMKVYNRSLKGFDIVCAAPNKKERFSSRIFYKIYSKYIKSDYKIQTESFRILSRRVINRISSMNKTVPYRKALYANQGLKTDYIKYNVLTLETIHRNKYEKKYMKGLAVDSLLLFTDAGYKVSLFMAMLMMGISLAMIIYTAVVFFSSTPVAGWTTTVLFMSIGLLGVFTILAIVVKYLQLILKHVYKRKYYNFESIEKLTK